MAFLIWVTGLAGAGKTTIAQEVYKKIKLKHPNTVLLDGDDYRKIMDKTTGHSRPERFEIAMQIARMCKFLVEQDINVVCSTISLFKKVHAFNRENFKDYFEVFIDCSMDELIKRDQKGIYSKAIKGEIKNVVGVDIAYDRPNNCHLIIDNTKAKHLNIKVAKILNEFERTIRK